MKPKQKLTVKQKKVLNFIIEYQEAHDGISPSLREVADAFDCHVQSVNQKMLSLMQKGYLSWKEPDRRRKIKILAAAE